MMMVFAEAFAIPDTSRFYHCPIPSIAPNKNAFTNN